MSLAFESPTQMNNTNEAYFTPLNMPKKEEETTPYFTAPISPSSLHQDFLNAIQARHATQPILLSTPPPTMPLNLNSSLAMRRNTTNTTIKPTSILSPLDPHQLNDIIDHAHILLLDVRSFVQYSHSRIRHAINVSIPNTILKRPTFTLDKVYEAIVLDQAREKLKTWESAEFIVFYDQQSVLLQENSAAAYLGSKLLVSGFKGKLHYIKGTHF